MKKIKLTVSALLLGSMCYSQCVNDSIIKRISYIESVNTIEDMIEWIRADIKTDLVRPEIGQMYVENLLELKSRLEDINTGIIRK